MVYVDWRCRCGQKEVRMGSLSASVGPLSNPLTGHFATTLPLMSFLSFLRLSDPTFSPFSVLGQSSFYSLILLSHILAGSIRTATKRAGGSVRNHGGSPGKRLGVKKFSGA
jgi:hypothetical protein